MPGLGLVWVWCHDDMNGGNRCSALWRRPGVESVNTLGVCRYGLLAMGYRTEGYGRTGTGPFYLPTYFTLMIKIFRLVED